MLDTVREIEQGIIEAAAALPNRFKPYLLGEKSASVAELFLNSYELMATKGSIQLRGIESNIAFVPGSIVLAQPAPESERGDGEQRLR